MSLNRYLLLPLFLFITGPSRSSGLSTLSQTKSWVKKSIVGLNLCPYAKDALDKIRIVEIDAMDPEGIVDALIEESALLLDGDAPSSTGSDVAATTSIVVATKVPCNTDGLAVWLEIDSWFQNFLEEDEAEEDPEEQLFAGELSCAFFHPEWRFADVAEDDPVNFERRAPFPIVSLLKKGDIKKLVDDGLTRGVAISEQIHNQNRETLRRIGTEKLAAMHEGGFLDDDGGR
jgi:hypothetical protein